MLLSLLSTPLSAQTSTFNPDPGAMIRAMPPPPFYQPPPGTPIDFGGERDPIADLPKEPVLKLHDVQKIWDNRAYPAGKLPPNTLAAPDRWNLSIPVWMRYNIPEPETPYAYSTPRLWDPYKQSVLKGDVPVLGQDVFLTLTASSFTSYEARDLPTPSGVSTASANSSEFYGAGNQQEVNQFLTFSVDLFKGETVFQPVTWLVHLRPVYNMNYTTIKENGVLSVDPRGSGAQADNRGVFTNHGAGGSNVNNLDPGSLSPGSLTPGDPSGLAGGGFEHVGAEQFGRTYTTRFKDFISLQEAFVEIHLADLSSNYDFLALRLGNQPLNSDFRGFVFNDTNLGLRLFGNAENNLYQYNFAAFDMREKDTYSELNTFDSRNQYVFVANLFRQDFFYKGYTAQLSFLTNLDNAQTHYDRTGNLVAPAVLGTTEPHSIHAYYFGWNGDGHIGRLNITHSFYEVVGTDSFNGLAGRQVDINAQMAAVEASYDVDWIRYKASFFYGSGDSKPTNGTATGFDSILDNPNFVGGPFSYYVRQGFVFGDTAVNFKQRNSLLLDLRSSKTEGQANYVNPGVMIFGVGTDMDILPSLKLFLNANYIRMPDVEPVDFALHAANTTPEIGFDLSAGIQYRPTLTDNIIISAGLGTLIPGNGYKAIYQSNTIPVTGYDSPPAGHVDNFLYSGFAAVTLTY